MRRCARCEWSEEYKKYHDQERGVPEYNDRVLFEFLILEGAQAWLSWSTILKKRAGYRKVCKDFDPVLCAEFTDSYLESLARDSSIIRHKLKIASIRKNARVFLELQKEYDSFSDYLWWWVEGKQIVNAREHESQCPASTPLSISISQDLKKRGMIFVWPTILYAYLQAVGVVDDHIVGCRKRKNKQ